MRQKFNPGDRVYVVERDEDGLAFDVSGYLFLAEVADAAIVTPQVCGAAGLEATMAYHINETCGNYGSDLAVFPMKDCYEYRSVAEQALYDEAEEEDA